MRCADEPTYESHESPGSSWVAIALVLPVDGLRRRVKRLDALGEGNLNLGLRLGGGVAVAAGEKGLTEARERPLAFD